MKDELAAATGLLTSANAGHSALAPLRGYVLVRELGRGGMGVVYLLERPNTGQRLALKLMLMQDALSDSSRELFAREMRNAQTLSHPNVVAQYGSGAFDNTLFVLLEFCDGGSVADLIAARGGRLDTKLAVDIARQALDGLAYVHQAPVSVALADGGTTTAKGLVHRDVKPANMLLVRDGDRLVAKVSDYGLAKAFATAGLSDHTLTGMFGGTYSFMPRQQLINFKYAGPEIDVWAAAASLYYMLTGKLPRDLARYREQEIILSTDAVPIRERLASVPDALATAIDRALLDRPDIVVRTAAELRQQLDDAAP